MHPPSIGKLRALQQLSNRNGKFSILALDHREALWKYLTDDPNQPISYDRMVEVKLGIVSELGQHTSALLLDPMYSAGHSIVTRRLSGKAGLMVSLESDDYGVGEEKGRTSRILEGWTVEKIKRMGASAVKFFMYYHPDSPTAGEQERLVAEIAADCRAQDIAFLLEIIPYAYMPSEKSSPSAYEAAKHGLLVRSAKRLCPLGVDIFKTEFPADVSAASEQESFAKAKLLAEAAGVPWVILSAGVGYELFKTQLRIACQAGGCGFVVGRSVWNELVTARQDNRPSHVQQALSRLSELEELADMYGNPWHHSYPAITGELGQGWYKDY